ncbi:hypothetical protein ACFFJB_02015 [Camelimonas abortus]|uniref:hypothetical protein n=1 Tax=Camelimonas abortus TaxID=1017184 RepID=UPI0035E7452C
MANWWDSYPDAPSPGGNVSAPATGGNWWDAYPDAPSQQSASPAPAQQFDTGRFDLGSVKNDPSLAAGLNAKKAGIEAQAATPDPAMEAWQAAQRASLVTKSGPNVSRHTIPKYSSAADRVGVAAGGFVEGIPIVGPILTGAAERAAVLVGSAIRQRKLQQPACCVAGGSRASKGSASIHQRRHSVGWRLVSTGAVANTPMGAKLLGDVGGNIGRRMAAGGISGGAIGGLDALTRSGGDLESAARGAALGGGIGFVAPAVISGVSKVADAAAKKASAGYRVKEALSRDAAAGNQMLTRQELAALQAEGVPVVVADMGGETTRALARSAANTSPEARDALNKVVSERFATQSTRIADDVAGLSPLGANATESLDKLRAAARAANRPRYAAAYAKGATGVWDDELAALTRAPDVADAIRKATRTGNNKAVADGFKPVTNPFVVTDAGDVVLRQAADGSTAIPSLQFWDYVKRNLDDTIEAAKRAGNRNAAADATALKQKLVAKLDAIVPEYAAARSGAAAFFGAEDALEAGQKFLTAKGQNEAYRKAWGQFSAPEKALFREGYASALASKLRETPDRLNAVNQLMRSPAERERIRMVFGPQGAAKLEARLRVENMDGLRTAVQGNSTTTRQLMEMGMAGGVGSAITGWQSGMDPSSMSIGFVLGAAARYGGGKIDARVAQQVGKLLSSSDPAMIDRAFQMAAARPAIMRLSGKCRADSRFWQRSYRWSVGITAPLAQREVLRSAEQAGAGCCHRRHAKACRLPLSPAWNAGRAVDQRHRQHI